MRILVADDNEDARQMVLQCFANAPDRQWVVVNNGADAWWHLSSPEERFDLAILDLSMPVVDGLQLLARIRADARLRDLEVIFTTAANDRPTLVKAAGLRVSGYLAKPYSRAALQQKVHEIEGRLAGRGARS